MLDDGGGRSLRDLDVRCDNVAMAQVVPQRERPREVGANIRASPDKATSHTCRVDVPHTKVPRICSRYHTLFQIRVKFGVVTSCFAST
jgi:hypothetical protein